MSDNVLDHLPALRAYARSLCRADLAEADDLVQETLLRAIERAELYKLGTNMRAWLFTIMRNRFLTNRVKAGRERTGDADCASLKPISPPGQEWSLLVSEMRDALNALPSHYREAIVLVGILGESYIDAARIMNCDIGTVKSRVNRARACLRELLGIDDKRFLSRAA